MTFSSPVIRPIFSGMRLRESECQSHETQLGASHFLPAKVTKKMGSDDAAVGEGLFPSGGSAKAAVRLLPESGATGFIFRRSRTVGRTSRVVTGVRITRPAGTAGG